MSHHADHAPRKFNETDPHGAGSHGQHASHVIVGPMQLRVVLVILLIFTFLTVAFAWGEQWAVDTFHIALPWWVNVYGAMIIAVIKAILVMAVFMQLKYDNPFNSVIMAFTFAALACFLTFTGIDLFNRDSVYEWKAGPVVAGGTGVSKTNSKPIIVNAREVHLAELEKRLGSKEAAAAEFARQLAEMNDHGDHAEHAATDPNANSANQTRAKVGRSDALAAHAAESEHAPAHGGAHEPAAHEPAKPAEHAPEAKPSH